ncbi:MAG: hypothetical protein GY705_01905 [Bacteroidetes bacterium]|nr:hypothetical protein [Bacteroidota bacterium]
MDWKFLDYFKTGPWINTEDYSIPVLIIFMLGCIFWLVAYAKMFTHARRNHSMEYPYFGQASSFAWEFWFGLGIIKVTNMGLLFQVAYFLWFFFDIFLVVLTWKYGAKQDSTESAKKSFRFKFIASIVFWLIVWAPFMAMFDDPVGCFSGWLCNNVISILFVFQKLKMPHWGTSRWIAIWKFLGTLFCSIVVWTHFKENTTLVFLAITFGLWDLVYIYLVFKGPKDHEVVHHFKPEPAQ